MFYLFSLALAAPNVAVQLQGGAESILLDGIAIDRQLQKVWIPAAGTGTVQVLDLATRTLKVADGFGTGTVTKNGLTRTIGPSSIVIGDRVAYIGDRADNTVCAVDVGTYIRGACAKLEDAPDMLAWIPSLHEVWVSTPKSHHIVVLDVSANPKVAATFEVPGRPSGFAVADAAGIVYVNFEDLDQTAVVDVKKRAVVSTWAAKCGDEGPKGLVLDPVHSFLVVACDDHLQTVDPARKGKILGTLATGGGVDQIDYAEKQGWFYAAAGRQAALTIAQTDAKGAFNLVATIPTAQSAWNAVVANDGSAVLTNGALGALLVVPPPDLSVPPPSGAPR